MQNGGDTIALSAIAVLDIGLEIWAIQAFGPALHSIVPAPFEGIVSTCVTDTTIFAQSSPPPRSRLRVTVE